MSDNIQIANAAKSKTIVAKIKRLSSSPKQSTGSYTYEVVSDLTPFKGIKMYGREGKAGKIIYVNKLKGNLEQEFEAKLTIIPRVSESTGELTHQIVFALSDAERNTREELTKQAQHFRTVAKALGVNQAKAMELMFQQEMAKVYAPKQTQVLDQDVNP